MATPVAPSVRAAAPAGSLKPGERGPVRSVDSVTHIKAPVSIDLFETGGGQLHVKGVTDEPREPFSVYQQDGKWQIENWSENVSDGTSGPTARNLRDLAATVADRLNVGGLLSINDEREHGKAGGAFEYVPKAKAAGPKRGSIEAKIAAKEAEIERRKGSVSLAREARSNTGSRIQSTRESRANAALNKARSELAELQRQRDAASPATPAALPEAAPRTEAFDARRATGGNLPPRREDETDGMYQLRVASDDDTAERLAAGYGIAGLKALLRAAGIPFPAGASRVRLVELALGPRRRYWDSVGISQQR